MRISDWSSDVCSSDLLGIERDQRSHIKTDEYCRTNVPGIYAIGDCTEGPWLAHKASHEGVIAVEHIAEAHPHPMDRNNIPGCTYCHPQVASVGLTEAKAKEAGYKIGRASCRERVCQYV